MSRLVLKIFAQLFKVNGCIRVRRVGNTRNIVLSTFSKLFAEKFKPQQIKKLIFASSKESIYLFFGFLQLHANFNQATRVLLNLLHPQCTNSNKYLMKILFLVHYFHLTFMMQSFTSCSFE
jgi:hypothetical protein